MHGSVYRYGVREEFIHALSLTGLHVNHSKLVAGCLSGLSLTQYGSHPLLSRPSALMKLGLLWNYQILLELRRLAITLSWGSDLRPLRDGCCVPNVK